MDKAVERQFALSDWLGEEPNLLTAVVAQLKVNIRRHFVWHERRITASSSSAAEVPLYYHLSDAEWLCNSAKLKCKELEPLSDAASC